MGNVDTNRIQYIAILGSILFLVFIIELIRKRKLKEEYSLIWLTMSVVFIIFSIWRKGLETVSAFIGVDYPPSALFLFLLVGIIFILIQYSVIISKVSNQNKILTQEIGLIKHEFEEFKKNNESGKK